MQSLITEKRCVIQAHACTHWTLAKGNAGGTSMSTMSSHYQQPAIHHNHPEDALVQSQNNSNVVTQEKKTWQLYRAFKTSVTITVHLNLSEGVHYNAAYVQEIYNPRDRPQEIKMQPLWTAQRHSLLKQSAVRDHWSGSRRTSTWPWPAVSSQGGKK